MYQFLLVGAGGAVGAMARFGIGRLAGTHLWPVATFIANVSGGFLMGILAGILAFRGSPGPWQPLLGVGLLGGYTTFSSFSLEVVLMIERHQWWLAIGYATASVFGAVLALAAGLWIARSVA